MPRNADFPVRRALNTQVWPGWMYDRGRVVYSDGVQRVAGGIRVDSAQGMRIYRRRAQGMVHDHASCRGCDARLQPGLREHLHAGYYVDVHASTDRYRAKMGPHEA